MVQQWRKCVQVEEGFGCKRVGEKIGVQTGELRDVGRGWILCWVEGGVEKRAEMIHGGSGRSCMLWWSATCI